jgi:pimeloyl-ACP methyl ester carboxylesterase
MTPGAEITIADGTTFACDHLDADGPTIILLHAGVADRRAWRDVAAVLNVRGADVWTYDRRGFGETPGTDGDYDHTDDLIAVLNLITPDPVWLVGNSQGGRISIDLALADPERVAGLVLIAPAVSGAPEKGDDQFDPATREIFAAMDEVEDEGDADLVNQLEVRLWLDGPSGPAGRVGGQILDLALDMNAIALVSAQPEDGGSGDRDAWSRLEQIAVPATVAWGELDIPIVIDECRTLAERLPGAGEPVVIEAAAHLPGLERPDVTADLIARAAGL